MPNGSGANSVAQFILEEFQSWHWFLGVQRTEQGSATEKLFLSIIGLLWSKHGRFWTSMKAHLSCFLLTDSKQCCWLSLSLFLFSFDVFFFYIFFLAPAYRMERVTPLGILSLVLNIMCAALNLIRGVHLAEHSFQVKLTWKLSMRWRGRVTGVTRLRVAVLLCSRTYISP